MNKKLLKSLIKEVQQEIKEKTKETTFKDELGKFFIVTKPLSKTPMKDDILVEVDLLSFVNQITGGLTKEEILGVFRIKSDANRFATEIIMDYEKQLKEVESDMEEYRKSKADLDAKKQTAKEKLLKLKG
jgi:hypothetical protein